MADSTRILFISGSIGLGHVLRDLAIAGELRRQRPGVAISWLAATPADGILREAGETVLPECADLADANAVAERAADGPRLSLIRYGFSAARTWSRNIAVLRRVVSRERFDLVLGDETYDVTLALKKDRSLKTFPYATIYDFVGFQAMTGSLLERLGVWFWNHAWSKGADRASEFVDLSLFVGEEEDVPDEPFGPMLPNRRDWARKRCRFVGHVLPFDPAGCADRAAVRARLGYGPGPLVVGAIGGTAIGKELLELCGRAWPILRDSVPELRMVLVTGPRLDPAAVAVPRGVEVRGYVPALHEHFAACDLAIVQGGGTTTIELTVLRRPFLYFPLEGHCEQEVSVGQRLARHGAGVRMSLSRTTPEDLAKAAIANLGKEPVYRPVAADGAAAAARLVLELADRGRG